MSEFLKPKIAWVILNMPAVLPPFRAWRIVIYPNDHRPPHVHVLGVEEHARFELLCDLARVKLCSQKGFTLQQLRQLAAYLTRHIGQLCQQWENIHG